MQMFWKFCRFWRYVRGDLFADSEDVVSDDGDTYGDGDHTHGAGRRRRSSIRGAMRAAARGATERGATERGATERGATERGAMEPGTGVARKKSTYRRSSASHSKPSPSPVWEETEGGTQETINFGTGNPSLSPNMTPSLSPERTLERTLNVKKTQVTHLFTDSLIHCLTDSLINRLTDW